MIKFQLSYQNLLVEVSVNADHPDKRAEVVYKGDAAAIAVIKPLFSTELGAFGHPIGKETSPFDLAAAMANPAMRQFSPILVEGADLASQVSRPEPDAFF